MDGDGEASNSEENIVMFGFLIKKKILGKDKATFEIKTSNTGIVDAEVILMVEAWLDKVKASYKDNITQNMTYKKKDDSEG